MAARNAFWCTSSARKAAKGVSWSDMALTFMMVMKAIGASAKDRFR